MTMTPSTERRQEATGDCPRNLESLSSCVHGEIEAALRQVDPAGWKGWQRSSRQAARVRPPGRGRA